jgi:alpha-L-rhamnosidase
MTAPGDLRVEHLRELLGVGCRRPRLSWQLPSGTATQQAYRIRLASGEDSGWVTSRDSVLVEWPFAPLTSRQPVTWQVQVRTDRGESPWSPPAAFEPACSTPPTGRLPGSVLARLACRPPASGRPMSCAA